MGCWSENSIIRISVPYRVSEREWLRTWYSDLRVVDGLFSLRILPRPSPVHIFSMYLSREMFVRMWGALLASGHVNREGWAKSHYGKRENRELSCKAVLLSLCLLETDKKGRKNS